MHELCQSLLLLCIPLSTILFISLTINPYLSTYFSNNHAITKQSDRQKQVRDMIKGKTIFFGKYKTLAEKSKRVQQSLQ